MPSLNYEKCAICGERFKKCERQTVRESWLKGGGFGQVPQEAVVHDACDKNEQRRSGLKN
jgi:hypothetical protein